MDYYFTAKVEEELDLIEKGEKTYFEVIDSFFKKFKKELDNSYINNNFDICPKCGSVLIERKSSNGIFKGCNNYPRCKFISE
jgi:DNA topoisomerase-1